MIPRRTMVVAGTALGLGAAGEAVADAAKPVAPAAPPADRLGPLMDILQAGEALPGLRAVVVARQGRVLAERGYAGASTDTPQPVNSVTKSVCSMLVGQALRDGVLASLDATVAELLPEAVAEVPGTPAGAVTLRHLLAGRSGLGFDLWRFGELFQARSLTRFVLGQPAVPVPPPGWSYNDALVSLLAPILARAHGRAARARGTAAAEGGVAGAAPGATVGTGADDPGAAAPDLATLAQRGLFGPLGIGAHDWRRDREGRPLAAGGLALSPVDLLKLAQLMLDGGRWQGVQVLPEAWVAESLRPQGPATWRAGPVEDIGYGLLWFTGRLHGHRVAWAWGYGGQFALLAPALQLAVATAATSPPPSALRAQTDGVMTLVGRLLQAAG